MEIEEKAITEKQLSLIADVSITAKPFLKNRVQNYKRTTCDV